jgi:predicted phosphoadenosine phosphosulfate sulfurtransferase
MRKDRAIPLAAQPLTATPQTTMNASRSSLSVDVYTATQERLDFIFSNFKRVYVSFSGGKDSGVLLNLVVDYIRARGIKVRLGVQIMDNEANYTQSEEFMHRIIQANLDVLDVYWCCLPITLPCTVSSYEIDWQCWGEADRHRWIRPMPSQS